jgi:peptide/nickel transport system permease protein
MSGEAYIVTATAKGLGRRAIVVRHALRNSLFGLLTIVGVNIGSLIGGTVIIERIFALPGVGQLLLQAINTRDVIVVQAVVLALSVVTVLVSLTVDILYTALDPRVRYAAA